ncbi:putative cyclase [Rhizopogon vinicolor AM-OR11-026]|uniref:Putative cyclase n=1 Tax=Rhizopogon vinicolor AM-OR11-026 TaxID=1314800 RepID=A0A1B7MTS5_9AGAM|nr:putative cyclase [Rhizopogon vinicolor AM-OR11-026]
MIDLTHTLTTSTEAPMSIWPGHPRLQMNKIASIPEHDANVTAISLGSHTGTHIDAPNHFIADGLSIDKYDLNKLMGRALVIDVRGKKARETITWEDMEKWEGEMHEGVIVLMCTGWSQYWGKDQYEEHPFIDLNAAKKLIERGVRVIGCDTLSPDEMCSPTSEVHKVILRAGGAIAENLRGVEEVLGLKEPVVSLLPLKLDSCDGSPIRAIAWSAGEATWRLN